MNLDGNCPRHHIWTCKECQEKLPVGSHMINPAFKITIVPSERIDYCCDCKKDHGYECPKDKYEVISDTQERPMTEGEAEIAKGLDELFGTQEDRKELIKNSVEDFNNRFTGVMKELAEEDTQEGWREEFDMEFLTSYRDIGSDEVEYEVVGDVEEIKNFITEVETQAYKQGKADAYRESASVARRNTDMPWKNTPEHIAQAIEQLASNKE